MIELIVGEKGKGKTKTMLAKADNDSRLTGCNIIYIDINNKHINELNEHIQLLSLHEFHIKNSDMFIGFIYGIVSQNQNVDRIFLDNFLSVACISTHADTEAILDHLIDELNYISDKFETDFVIGLSISKEELSESLQEYVTISL